MSHAKLVTSASAGHVAFSDILRLVRGCALGRIYPARSGPGTRLTSAGRADPEFPVDLDATRKEPANNTQPAAHGSMLRVIVRW